MKIYATTAVAYLLLCNAVPITATDSCTCTNDDPNPPSDKWDVHDRKDEWVTHMTDSGGDDSTFQVDGVTLPINCWDVSRVQHFRQLFKDMTEWDFDLSCWNTESATNMQQMFWRASAFTGDVSNFNVEKVTSMASMFDEATNFNGDISSWRPSSVKDFSNFAYGASSFSPGDLSSWADSVSQATDTTQMWRGSAFNLDGDLQNWKLDSLTTMQYMFTDTNLDGTESWKADISGWTGLGNLQDMSYAFEGSSIDNDIGSWDVSSVTTFYQTFFRVSAFAADLSQWDVGSAIDMRHMLRGTHVNCDLSGWDVSRVTDMSRLFAENTVFDQDLSSWNTESTENFYYMFAGATAFKGEGLPSWKVGSAAGDSFKQMFSGATSFEQDLCSWREQLVDNSAAADLIVEDMFLGTACDDTGDPDFASLGSTNMCAYCAALNEDVSSEEPSSAPSIVPTSLPSAAPTNQPSGTPSAGPTLTPSTTPSSLPSLAPSEQPSDESSAGPSMAPTAHCFADTEELYDAIDLWLGNMDDANYDHPRGHISNWCTSKIADFTRAFNTGRNALAANFDEPLYWDMSNAQKLRRMFHGATSFTGVGLENWEVGSVSDFFKTFQKATSFNADLSDWDVSGAVTMQEMFRNAASFEGQGIGGWTFGDGLQNLKLAFRNAGSFNTNLCSWGDQVAAMDGVDLSAIFYISSCDITTEPALNEVGNGYDNFCQACSLAPDDDNVDDDSVVRRRFLRTPATPIRLD